MCHLKLAEKIMGGSSSDNGTMVQHSLNKCVDDCTSALDKLDSAPSTSNGASSGESGSNINNLRGKILYRRAKALVLLSTSLQQNDTANDSDDDDAKEKNLNAAAKDLLQLLSFDGSNAEAATLLRSVRAQHAKLGGGMGRSRISRALDCLRGAPGEGSVSGKTGVDEEKMDTLQCLRVLQGSLAEEIPSSAEEIGKRGGVPLLLQIARHRQLVPIGENGKKKDQLAQVPPQIQATTEEEQCRISSLHVLSACCSYDPFILKYAGRDNLPPAVLAQIVEEEAALSNDKQQTSAGGGGSADVAVAAMALLVRMIVHWDHREVVRFFAPKVLEDGTLEENGEQHSNLVEVDGSSVCRVATAAFLWGSFSSSGSNIAGDEDTRAPRAALDLFSAWTASDLDALDAASDACYAPSASDSSSSSSKQSARAKKASRHRITPEDVRQMKPRQVATHRKREGDYRRANLNRALQHVSAFCSEETGGLDAMLTCAAMTNDHRLRQEVGLQIGRLVSVYEEDDDVKKLLSKALGCTDWRVGREEEEGKGDAGLSTLTIEELDDEEKEEDELDGAEEILTMMKRGQLTASLLMGKPNVGTWALKHGWSDGNGVYELKQLISSDNSRAMSIASELVSAASSVEGSRPLLVTFVQEGTLEELLIHPDPDVRSGAASCAAKIGLASKALSADEGEVMGLLDVAIELLFDEDECGDEQGDENGKSNGGTSSSSKAKRASSLANKVPTSAAGGSTSMDRGIEVLAYLASKTFVKEKVASGYSPAGSPPNRKNALQRLVELAYCAPNTQRAYGIACIFNLVSVSLETLRKEAFIGKELTKEQYDQLQSMGKTEEEKEAEAKIAEKDCDEPAAVSERLRKLANANVPGAMVKLLEGSSSSSVATQEKLLEGMGRMASEPSVRGIMIQRGCLTACLQLDVGVRGRFTA